MTGADADGRAPLAGVRVLDLAGMLAGPYCASILGEFGAEIIKVELPGKGDKTRNFGTMTAAGSTLIFLSEARNKKSITLDLRKPKGVEIVKRLIALSDIVVENFMPGTLERWGIGYEEMKRTRSDIILVRISAYGQTGPYADRPGFARIAHGFAGLSYLAGEAGGRPVVPGATSLADYVTGLYGALGALLAYTARNRLGIGQYVDIGLYEGVLRMLDEIAGVYAKTGSVRERMGADTVNLVPHSHFKTNDGKWVALACSTQEMWQRLTVAMERPDLLAADKFATMAQRLAKRDEVNVIVADFIAGLTRDELLRRCQALEISAGPINSIADIVADPHIKARENLVEIDHPRAGKVVVPNVLPRLSETPGHLDWLGPDLGQHNAEIYGGLLGLSEAQMVELRQDGVI
jgi:crotonobetainyl-CoA:carnitine CoA-transferase CaiB-like acyl-CoA transferase